MRLVLRGSDAALTAAVALAQREKQCCAFFDVSIVLEADRRTLVLAVPDGAEEVLASFVLLLGRRGRGRDGARVEDGLVREKVVLRVSSSRRRPFAPR